MDFKPPQIIAKRGTKHLHKHHFVFLHVTTTYNTILDFNAKKPTSFPTTFPGFLASTRFPVTTTGFPVTTTGFPVTTNGFTVTTTGIPVTTTGFSAGVATIRPAGQLRPSATFYPASQLKKQSLKIIKNIFKKSCRQLIAGLISGTAGNYHLRFLIVNGIFKIKTTKNRQGMSFI